MELGETPWDLLFGGPPQRLRFAFVVQPRAALCLGRVVHSHHTFHVKHTPLLPRPADNACTQRCWGLHVLPRYRSQLVELGETRGIYCSEAPRSADVRVCRSTAGALQ